MLLALEGTAPETEQELREKPDRFISLLQKPRNGKPMPVSASAYGDLHQIIADIIAASGGQVALQDIEEIPELSASGTLLSHRFQVGLPIGSAKVKLESFHKQCAGERVREDDNGCLISIPLPTNFWGKMAG